MKLEDVPTFLGGKCNCSPGCIAGVPNNQTEPIAGISADGLNRVDVAARNVQKIELPVQKGMALNYTIKSESSKVNVSANFRNAAGNVKTLMEVQCLKGEEASSLAGRWEIEEEGTVELSFDNTHSIFFSKSVSYKVDYDLKNHVVLS